MVDGSLGSPEMVMWVFGEECWASKTNPPGGAKWSPGDNCTSMEAGGSGEVRIDEIRLGRVLREVEGVWEMRIVVVGDADVENAGAATVTRANNFMVKDRLWFFGFTSESSNRVCHRKKNRLIIRNTQPTQTPVLLKVYLMQHLYHLQTQARSVSSRRCHVRNEPA